MRGSGVTLTVPAEIMAMPRFHATIKLSAKWMDKEKCVWEWKKLFPGPSKASLSYDLVQKSISGD